MMKLIIAIVQDQDQNELSRAFYDANVRATKLSTTGGFLRAGNTTFMIGIEEERIEEVLKIIDQCSKAREQYVSAPLHLDMGLVWLPIASKPSRLILPSRSWKAT